MLKMSYPHSKNQDLFDSIGRKKVFHNFECGKLMYTFLSMWKLWICVETFPHQTSLIHIKKC